MVKEKNYSTDTEFLSVGNFVYDKPGMKHLRRKIPSFVLLVGIKGDLHIADGDLKYTLSPDEYLILAADREHYGYKESSEGVSYYWCHFNITGEYRLEKDMSGREILSFGEDGAYKISTFGRLLDSHKIHLLCRQLMDTSSTDTMLTRSICQSFLNALIGELALNLSELSVINKEKVYSVIEWIKLNATGVKNIKEIASFFGYNPEYLTTLIKKTTGKTLIEHLNDSRIERAEKLLLSHNLSIMEVAYTCGFSDEKYFSRVFKKKNGLSPVRYKNAYCKRHLNNE